jgi:hypothetical protein
MDKLPDAKICATTVTPNADGFFVEQVADGEAPTDESAAIPPPTVRLSVGVQIPASRLPTLASVQKDAMHLLTRKIHDGLADVAQVADTA